MFTADEFNRVIAMAEGAGCFCELPECWKCFMSMKHTSILWPSFKWSHWNCNAYKAKAMLDSYSEHVRKVVEE